MELFGEAGDGSRHEPFHLYPMRQAIEEGFIEDVLAGYLTYNQYFHLEKAILDDPEYDTDKARTALARFVTLHPDNLAQKAEIIVEHFRTKIARQVGGQAKAMVVCSSRPHAARMWEALRGIDPSNFPVLERIGEDEVFWLRTPTSTISISETQDRDQVIARRWAHQ